MHEPNPSISFFAHARGIISSANSGTDDSQPTTDAQLYLAWDPNGCDKSPNKERTNMEGASFLGIISELCLQWKGE